MRSLTMKGLRRIISGKECDIIASDEIPDYEGIETADHTQTEHSDVL